MKNDGHRESHSTRSIRALQVAACFLLVLWFAMTAAVNAKSPSAVPNLARTSTPTRTRTPTLTPTRSLTPRTQAPKLASAPSIPGQTQVDPNTVALYHFDSPSGNLAIDATGRYTGTLDPYGNAVITNTGLYAGVLVLNPTSTTPAYVRTGNLGTLNSGTVEAFVDFQSACFDPLGNPTAEGNFTIVSAGGDFGGGQPGKLFLGAQTGLMFGININGQWIYADSGINPCRYLTGPNPPPLPLWPYETWRFHHVAGTWGPRGLEIWVDGILHGVGNTYLYANINPYPYMCNPQTQVGESPYPPNPLYPYACQTPVMAPTMPSYPPGDYTGGLPAYTTFLIGCSGDPSQYCFKGSIDEVRISNVQRTFAWTVDPTVTPTPTQTPVQITGAYAVTDNTLGLYHLDTIQSSIFVKNEVTQSYDATTNGQLVPGHFGYGVFLNGIPDADGNGRGISLQNSWEPWAGTVEAWINPSADSWSPTILSAIYDTYLSSYNQMLLGGIGSNATLGMGYVDASIGDWRWADSGVSISSLIGSWHHVAGTWGPRGLEIWIDGVLRATGPYTGHPYSISRYAAGCDASTPPNCMIGTIDEIRVSNVQRTYSPVILATPTCTPTPMPSVTPSVLSVTPSAYRLFLPLVRGMIC